MCKNSLIGKSVDDKKTFTPKQLPRDPANIIFLGQYTTRIAYNATEAQWKLSEVDSDVTAVSSAIEVSYAIGKHAWTISNDSVSCYEGKPYTTELKLTGCAEKGEFTCNDGQCITMEERCNQLADCRDKSDEKGCQLIILEDGYNKDIPPIKKAGDGGLVPAGVSISITLRKVVDVDETDHSIHLQFEISMKWKENRVRYLNLKSEASLNLLSEKDTRTLWLPLVIYQNTDQKESTRLGVAWEWMTRVMVNREGGFKRNGLEEIDEAEIFEGEENNLTMVQTYTHEFQCQYQLHSYPFDTQVSKNLFHMYILALCPRFIVFNPRSVASQWPLRV